MDVKEFMEFPEESKRAFLESADANAKKIGDLESERDSLLTENNKMIGLLDEIKKELKETKEMNFTLARQLSRAPEEDAETLLHELFMKRG